MEYSQRLPRHSSHTLQGDTLKWETKPGTHSGTHRWTTGMGSGANITCQTIPASDPVPGQVERVLGSSRQLGASIQRTRGRTGQGIL